VARHGGTQIILGMWEAEMGELWIESSPGKKVSKTISQNTSCLMLHACNPRETEGGGRKISVGGPLRQKRDPI
jgi:hypothetical protein